MIVAENITKSYNGECVLRGVSLTVEDGEFVSIMGESGSGKSTLISILGGYLEKDGGSVLIDGVDISALGERETAEMRSGKLGFVFQHFKLIPTLNVKDNLLLPAILGKKANAENIEYMKNLASELGVSELMSKYPDELSGGQMQRVAIIRALIYRPSILILDEPTGALDSNTERRVMEVLSRINRESGTTIIQVTHSKTVAEYASRTIYIKDGEILQ